MVFDSKRGQGNGVAIAILTFVLVVIFSFGFVVINLFGDTVLSVVNEEITVENGYTNESVSTMTHMTNDYGSMIDGVGLFFFVGLWILIMILAYNSHAHPFIGVLAFILLIVISIVGMILSNSWEEISGDSDISASAAKLPMMSFILNNYLIYVLVVGASMIFFFFVGYNSI